VAKILIGRNLSAGTDSVTVPGIAYALVSEEHDWIGLTYNTLGKIATATYKLGGAGGTTVATLTLGYTAGRLTSIAKT
jgi:hypothetical protein